MLPLSILLSSDPGITLCKCTMLLWYRIAFGLQIELQ